MLYRADISIVKNKIMGQYPSAALIGLPHAARERGWSRPPVAAMRQTLPPAIEKHSLGNCFAILTAPSGLMSLKLM